MKPEDDPTSIGNVLIEMGAVTSSELVEKLKKLSDMNADMLLGQFLIAEGLLSEQELELALLKQKKLRQGTVSNIDVMKIMEIANRTQKAASLEADTLSRVLANAMIKASS